MILTNNLRLPEPLVDSVSYDTYSKGDADISVTELLQPPQLRRLRIEHDHEITEDVVDRLWSLLGQATHSVIERAAKVSNLTSLSEVTLTTNYGGWKLKGQLDHVALSTSELFDFKVTSVYKVKGGKLPFEWEAQTNIYRHMLRREKGLAIEAIAIIAILRDWSRNEAGRNSNYPDAQGVRIDVPLWSAARTEDFIMERIALHQATEPVPCTDEDRWTRRDLWAVMKRGNTRAVKLFEMQHEAEALASTASNLFVAHRPGYPIRCQTWCPVSRWCTQWAADPRNIFEPSITESLFDAKV